MLETGESNLIAVFLHFNLIVYWVPDLIWQVEMLKDSLPLVEELHLMGNKLRGITVSFPLLELLAVESQISDVIIHKFY